MIERIVVCDQPRFFTEEDEKRMKNPFVERRVER